MADNPNAGDTQPLVPLLLADGDAATNDATSDLDKATRPAVPALNFARILGKVKSVNKFKASMSRSTRRKIKNFQPCM